MISESIALLALLSAASVLAVPTTPPVEMGPERLAHLAKIADEQGKTPGFWTAQISRNSPEQCSISYFDMLTEHFDAGNRSPSQDAFELLGLLKKSKFAYCDKQFSAPSMKIIANCRADSYCEGFVKGFSATHGQFESRSAGQLADTMAKISEVRITSPEEFDEVYWNQGPCKVVSDTLDEPDMSDYRKFFVSIVTLPEHYEEFSDTNKQAARIVGACQLMQTNSGLLQEAYEIYARQ